MSINNTKRYIKRIIGGTILVLFPTSTYVVYKYRPRASFDIDYHESLVCIIYTK